MLSLGALELMKDENELETLSQAQKDAVLDSAAEIHEVMTDAAAVLARTLIGQANSVSGIFFLKKKR